MARLPNYDPAEHTVRLSDLALTRRETLQRAGMGMGALSLSWLLGDSLLGATAGTPKTGSRGPLAIRKPHFAGKATKVIHIFASGRPSHVDTFDPTPVLAKYEDQALPGLTGLAYPSPFKFERGG